MSADDKNSALIIMKSRFSTGKFVYPLMLGAFILTFTHLDDWVSRKFSINFRKIIALDFLFYPSF